MRLDNLSPSTGSKSPRRRIGRGNASGTGTTAGKGTKGQKARSGGANSFYRGMSSRMQRYGKLPGFNNKWRVEFQVVQLRDLDGFDAGATVNEDALRERGLVRGKNIGPIKVIGNAELTKALTVDVARVSSAARERIEGAGGTVVDQAS
jgi:large subunit ribosomal protein L15